jgi:glycerol kinase
MKKRHVASSLALGGVAAAAGVATMVVSKFNDRKHREEAQLEARRQEKADARRRERYESFGMEVNQSHPGSH